MKQIGHLFHEGIHMMEELLVGGAEVVEPRLTPEGRKLLKRAQTATLVAEEQMLNSISPDELRQLKRLLFKAGNCANDTATASGRC